MTRTRAVLLVCLAALGAVAAGCGDGMSGTAAVVNGATITRADLLGELEALAGNRRFRELADAQLAQADPPVSLRPTPGTFDAGVTASWLRSMIVQEVIDQEFTRRGLRLGPRQRAEARARMAGQFGGADVFAAFPDAFRRTIVEREAKRVAVNDAAAGGPAAREAALASFFAANRERLCQSGRLVWHILVAGEERAGELAAELAGGASFEDLARRFSTDTGSARNGGLLGCLQPGAFVPEFQQVAETLTPGSVSGPVRTQYGWHLIRVEPFTLEAGRALVEQAYAQQGGAGDRWLLRALRRAEVRVDPRYGTLRRDPQQGIRIEPRRAPDPRARP